MGRWLAALAAILIAVLVLLWRQLGSPPATAAPTPAPTRFAGPAFAGAAAEGDAAEPAAEPAAAAAEAAPAAPDPASEKMDPQSDEFFREHDQIVIPNLMRNAVKCWENQPKARRKEFHRNQSMVATFKQRIRDGVVTIYDVVVERSSLNDAALEACVIEQLRSTTWSNKRLPDWEQDDQIKLGPRTLKKYMRWNVEADEHTLDEE